MLLEKCMLHTITAIIKLANYAANWVRLINIYLGPPLPPMPQVDIASDTEILITWQEPFSWPNHEIQGYSVIETIAGWSREFNTTEQAIRFTNTSLSACEVITYQIAAFSDLGRSQIVSISTGFPISESYLCHYYYYINGVCTRPAIM